MLYDHLGRPIQAKELTREHAAPSLVGVRTVWGIGSVAAGLTPARLAAVLRAAADGEPSEYLVLAEEMEEREWHYASVLGTRKRAVSGLEPVVEAATDEKADQDRADAVRELTRRPEFRGLLFDLLDGLGKGYAAVEIMWDRSGARWWPGRYEWRDPRFFRLDRDDGKTLRLLDEQDVMFGVPLAPYKWIVHQPKLKSGLPIRGGLARLASAACMCKSFTLTDWMQFAEIFGMPLRLGRYGQGATEEDIRKLVAAVANLGTDAAAVVPESMKIEFQEAGKGAGNGAELFLRLAEWLDKQISKAVLGQTMTSDDGSSKSQAEVHDEVRKDIKIDDALQLEATINRDLIQPFIDLNFGPQRAYPRCRLPVPESEDLVALADVLSKLVPLGGLGIQASLVRDRIGFADPDPGAELLGAQYVGQATAENRRKALNRAAGQELTDDLAAQELEDWEPLAAPVMDPVLRLAAESESFEEFLAGLAGLAGGGMDSSALARSLAEVAFKARGAGDAGDA